MGRVVKSHNLLQTLTRVNRPFNKFEYGYVVDFADIEKEFEKTNKNYFLELQNELGDEIESYSNLFKTEEEIINEIEEIKEILFHYDTSNAENFSQQISELNDRAEVTKVVRILNNAKNLYNIIKLSGQYELLEKINFKKLNILSKEANNRLAIINLKQPIHEN